MSWFVNVASVLIVIGASLAFVGCGDSGKIPVAGSVKVDGVLLDQGMVTFLPVDGGRSGSGKIDSDGTYKISYLSIGDGMPPGDYIVTVLADEFTAKGKNTGAGGADQDLMNVRGKLKHLVPVQYNSKETSPLRITIADGTAEEYAIEIDTSKK